MRVYLLTRAWVSAMLKKSINKPKNPTAVSLTDVLNNAIKMQAVTMGSKVRIS